MLAAIIYFQGTTIFLVSFDLLTWFVLITQGEIGTLAGTPTLLTLRVSYGDCTVGVVTYVLHVLLCTVNINA